MPPLARRDVRNLVRKLGASARPSQQREALDTMEALIFDGYSGGLAAIPPLVLLLGAGSSAGVQGLAAVALTNLLAPLTTKSPSLLRVPSLYSCSCWGLALQLPCGRLQQQHSATSL
ncbi:hypothetical protein FOA52_015348 [Chlamydomonas sp. UWO 241]|nr:hypothetical protein FOA52_015348 [Chlamydomonas sp. UWO 241]